MINYDVNKNEHTAHLGPEKAIAFHARLGLRYYSVEEAFFVIRKNYGNDFTRWMSLRCRTI